MAVKQSEPRSRRAGRNEKSSSSASTATWERTGKNERSSEKRAGSVKHRMKREEVGGVDADCHHGGCRGGFEMARGETRGCITRMGSL